CLVRNTVTIGIYSELIFKFQISGLSGGIPSFRIFSFLPHANHFIIKDYTYRMTDKPSVAEVIFLVTIQVNNLVAEAGVVQVGFPLEVASLNIYCAKRNLHTIVLELAQVSPGLSRAGGAWQVTEQQQIFGAC